jgi:hypothetical protein
LHYQEWLPLQEREANIVRAVPGSHKSFALGC